MTQVTLLAMELPEVMPRLRAVNLSNCKLVQTEGGVVLGTRIKSQGVRALVESTTSLRVYHQYFGVDVPRRARRVGRLLRVHDVP